MSNAPSRFRAGDTFSGRPRDGQFENIFNPDAEIIQERKWKDQPATLDAGIHLMNRETFNVTVLNGLQVGTSQNQRVGGRVIWRNIAVRGSIEGNADSESVCDPCLCSIWLIYDKQFNGTTPTAADILQYGVAGAGGTGNPSSVFLNMYNSERFVVLRRYMRTMAPWEKESGQTGYAGSPSVDTIDWHLDVELETIYSSTGAGATNIRSGAILLCSTGDVAPRKTSIPINNDWKFLYHTRLRYVDG